MCVNRDKLFTNKLSTPRLFKSVGDLITRDNLLYVMLQPRKQSKKEN